VSGLLVCPRGASLPGEHWRAVVPSADPAAKLARMSALRWVLVFALAVLAGGCGESDTVDANEVERQIEQNLSTATTQIESVSCPDDVKSETGAKFTCSAEFDAGGSAKVDVTETDAPNEFSYTFKAGTVTLAGASVEQALEDDLAAQGIANATVDCPSKVKVETGSTVTCQATGAGGGVGSVTFEFSDASGSIDSASVDTGS
jgi:hypothetical protein